MLRFYLKLLTILKSLAGKNLEPSRKRSRRRRRRRRCRRRCRRHRRRRRDVFTQRSVFVEIGNP